MTLIDLPHGVTEVHLPGQCYRLVPTPRAQSDPFNHANERLTGPHIGNFVVSSQRSHVDRSRVP
jgi:hypothetical protein